MLEHFNPTAASYAGDIDQLVWIVTWLVGFWFIAAEVMFFWLIWRFRKRDGVKSQYITGKEKHLKRWINVPHAIVLAFDAFIIVAAVRVWVLVKQTLPPADRTVRVESQQWAWTFQDPGADDSLGTADDIRTTDQMHVEVGKTYHFLLESKDVLHSFFIPAFRLKQDAIPGRTYTGWFKPTKAGEFDIQCAEICGLGHGVMGARLVVDTPEQHAAWVRENTPEAAAEAAPESATTSTPADSAAAN